MTIQSQLALPSTSAAGAMSAKPYEPRVLRLIYVNATTTALSTGNDDLRAEKALETNTGTPVPQSTSVMHDIATLHRLIGLTWEQLACIFRVTRRALHFWASGKQMAANNEERLQRLLACVRKIDRGSASANRACLTSATVDGRIPLDLLVQGQYQEVVSLLGHAVDTTRLGTPKFTNEVIKARAPLSPDALVGALQDRVHRELGRSRAAKSIKVRSGKRAEL